jgi:tetratricopeptide (TPR) repeat protein
MSSSAHDHPIAGFAWLLVAFGLIGLAGKAGIEKSAKSEINQEIRKAVDLGRNGDYQLAEEKLRSVLRRHPSDPDALFNLGVALLAQERDDDADTVFAQVLEVTPDDYDALAERAGIQKRKGRVDEAFALLDKIPVGRGNLKERLAQDPLWKDVAADHRMIGLKKKHALDDIGGVPSETTLRRVEPEPQ